MRQILLQNVTASLLKNCNKSLLQNASDFLLQNELILLKNARFITKYNVYYRMRQYHV